MAHHRDGSVRQGLDAVAAQGPAGGDRLAGGGLAAARSALRRLTGGRTWVLSRGLCRYTLMPAPPEMSAAERQQATALRARGWAPYDDAELLIDTRDRGTMVWAWDRAGVDRAIAGHGVSGRRPRVLPETALYRPGQGARLLACMDGVEGQVWDDGVLLASRWWPQSPSLNDWFLFLRHARVDTDGMNQVPAPERPVLLDQPWVRGSLMGGLGMDGLSPGAIAAAVALLLALPVVYLGGQAIRHDREVAAVEQALAENRDSAREIFRARAEALSALREADALLSLSPYPPQPVLMADVAKVLPTGVTIQGWTYAKGTLRLTLTSARPLDVLAQARLMGQVAALTDVEVEPSPAATLAVIRARVRRSGES